MNIEQAMIITSIAWVVLLILMLLTKRHLNRLEVMLLAIMMTKGKR